MTRTAQLLALAEAATTYCNKCGYIGKDEPLHKRPKTSDECCYQAARMMWVRPDDIKQLVELVRLQHEALLVHIALTRPINTSRKAIEAFNKWEGECPKSAKRNSSS